MSVASEEYLRALNVPEGMLVSVLELAGENGKGSRRGSASSGSSGSGSMSPRGRRSQSNAAVVSGRQRSTSGSRSPSVGRARSPRGGSARRRSPRPSNLLPSGVLDAARRARSGAGAVAERASASVSAAGEAVGNATGLTGPSRPGFDSQLAALENGAGKTWDPNDSGGWAGEGLAASNAQSTKTLADMSQEGEGTESKEVSFGM